MKENLFLLLLLTHRLLEFTQVVTILKASFRKIVLQFCNLALQGQRLQWLLLLLLAELVLLLFLPNEDVIAKQLLLGESCESRIFLTLLILLRSSI